MVVLGHRHDQRWLAGNFRQLPEHFRKPVATRYKKIYPQSRRDANTLLRETVGVVTGGSGRMASNDDELCAWAAARAKACRFIKARADDLVNAFIDLYHYVSKLGFIPEGSEEKKRSLIGAVARMCCERWWRRQVRKKHGRNVEAAAIKIGLVNRRAGIYCSDETKERRRQQRSRNLRMLESCLAVNELDQSYTLKELADLSVSNPVIRRGEFMTRIAGFSQYAENNDLACEFYTWTCPSRMHYVSKKYDGTTPVEAQQYLCRQWAKARAAMSRAGVTVFGFRVAEPHHDGTPHWHMMFFMDKGRCDDVRAILERYALQVDGGEKGAEKYRFDAKSIEPGKAAGYLAKYISKNIDGFGLDYVDEDTTGRRDPMECARRVDAWASTWGIRQFQQVGGPSVSVWRELRKVRDEQAGAVEAVRYCADQGNWFGFMREMIKQPVRLLKCWSDKPGAYDEPVGDRVIGVECGDVMLVTRVHEWRVERGGNTSGQILLGVEAAGVGDKGASMVENESATEGMAGRSVGMGAHGNVCAFLSEGEAVAPWSSVNNCTGVRYEANGGESKDGAGGRSKKVICDKGSGQIFEGANTGRIRGAPTG